MPEWVFVNSLEYCTVNLHIRIPAVNGIIVVVDKQTRNVTCVGLLR